jgi:hypothetical protein
MTPEEQAYEKARRRIRVAEEFGELALDLSGGNRTKRDYTGPKLAKLTRLPKVPRSSRLVRTQRPVPSK